MHQIFRKLLKTRLILISITFAALYFVLEEYLYTFSKYNFNNLKCVDDKVCVRILFVADPQIIGFHNEIVHPLTGLSIFDIDRYLSRTYNVAFNFVKPNLTVFLGDLFDEGSTATETEFETYVSRFRNIYGFPSETLQHFYLPGDNDIGGEGLDIVTYEKVLRFDNAFEQSDVVQWKSIEFYLYNRLTNGIVTPIETRPSGGDYVNIGFSHIPILRYESSYTSNVLEATRPHVIFSAHDHKAAIIEYDKTLNLKNKKYILPEANQVYEYLLSDDKIIEFQVPTVSYRMGTNKIGHGYAILEGNRLTFTVLWSPRRFPQLTFYAVLVLIGVLYGIFTIFKMCINGRPKRYSNIV